MNGLPTPGAEMPVQDPGVMGQQAEAPVSDEQMQQLQELASKVEEAYQRFNSMRFMSQNKSEAEKIDFIKQAIQMLEDAGIDPNDPEQINNFISELEEMDPDLAEMFTTSFEALLGDENAEKQEGQIATDMGEAPMASEEPEGQQPQAGPGAFQNLMGQMGGGQQ